MRRILAFDTIRWIMAIVIVMYHIFVNFYNNIPSMRYLSGGYLAVEGFFIISGFLLMKSFFSYQQKYMDYSPYQQLKQFTISKIRRLYPEFLFIFIITVIIRYILHQPTPWHLWMPNLLMMGNLCGIQGIVRDVWFISSLFWLSIFLFGMMLFYDKKFYLFFLPIIILLCYLFLIDVSKVLTIHSAPIYFNIISGGVIRAFLGLGIGIISYLCKDYIGYFSNKFIFFIELLCILYSIYIICHGQINFEVFNFYISFSIITIILYNKRETILRILSWKILEKISSSSYMLFLSHLLIIENLSRYFKNQILQYNSMMVLLIITTVSVIIGYILYIIFIHISKKIKPYVVDFIFKH